MGIRFIHSVVAHLSILLVCIAATIFFSSTCNAGDSNSTTAAGCCIEEERQGLVQFKNGGLVDPSGLLSSWTGEDCCTWHGVRCSNQTGHVTKLLLRSPSEDYGLSGEVSPSLLQLKHLRYLDLSNNNFFGTSFPGFIGSLSRLRYLNLSHTYFGGIIPHQFGNLSDLRYLDLGGSSNNILPVVDSLHWLSGLSSLQYLDMSYINLTEADVFNAVNGIPGLQVLRLSYCQLNHRIPASLQYHNLTSSLQTLDLSSNYFTSTLPDWIFNISSLVSVDLGSNMFHGSISGFGNLSSLQVLNLAGNSFNASIPTNFGNLCSLRTLVFSSNGIQGDASMLGFDGCATYSLQTLHLEDNLLTGKLPAQIGDFTNLEALYLDNNMLSGPIPSSIGRLSALKYLRLANNSFAGTIPLSLSMLSELVVMDLSFNSLEGFISDSHFANMTKLESLLLSSNSLAVRMSSDWVPPFQLKNLGMRSCVLGPNFPAWLRKQTALSTIDISNASISDTVPDWFWNLSSSTRAHYLNISHNQINGSIPDSVTLVNISVVDLSYNQFRGPLPRVGEWVHHLYLSNNFFSGDLLPVFNNDTSFSTLSVIMLSKNLVSGSIPASICRWSLSGLDLSSNLLSGKIPHCNFTEFLYVINLANNNLSGVIPQWIGSAIFLEVLHLNNNSLHGKIPSLKRSSKLEILDLGENRLRGNIPTWIGESLLSLTILRLRSNLLEGIVPQQLSHLKYLQVLDLADNNLSGNMPRWLGNLSAMALANQTIHDFLSLSFSVEGDNGLKYRFPLYEESLLVTIKGMELEYTTTLSLVLSLDLSSNNLCGDIPQELTGLLGLQNLNLSNNHLNGAIPERIGGMLQLESLDLSGNQLYGAIPSSISSLTYLSHLNLSNNNLSGRIPLGNQIQTLADPSIYIGNHDLCGSPLPNKCPGDETAEAPISATDTGDGEISDNLWYYVGAVCGFVVGFWTVCGPLLLNQSWRVSYYKFIDKMFF